MANRRVTYNFGSFSIDPLERTLTREDVPVPLTPLAFNTLLFLAENSGKLVTRNELIAAIWPDTMAADPNLAVMIHAVRKALADDGQAQRCIETVAKFGYRFTIPVQRVFKNEAPQSSAVIPPQAVHSGLPKWLDSGSKIAVVVMLLILLGVGVVFSDAPKRLSLPPARSNSTSIESAIADPETTGIFEDPRAEAHTWYLKGRYFWNRGTEAGLKRSIVYFRKAISAEPRSALAYSGLADAYGSLAAWSVQPSDLAYRRAEQAATRAVSLDSSLSTAHSALGKVALREWKWDLAEHEFRRALELKPNDSVAHQRFGQYLAARGDLSGALKEMRTARDLDPLSLKLGVWVGLILYESRQYDAALAEYRKVIELDPSYSEVHYYTGLAYFVQRDFTNAIPELEIACTLSNHREPLSLALYAAAKGQKGDRGAAQATLGELRARSQKEYVSPLSFALLYLGLEDWDEALNWIEKVFQEHIPTAAFAGVDPIFDPVREEPRFLSLLQRARIGEASSLAVTSVGSLR